MRVAMVRIPAWRRDGRANLGRVREMVAADGVRLGDGDVLVLPELVGGELDADAYTAEVTALARGLGCHVVGGSHHDAGPGGVVNRGLVADGAGEIVAWYAKTHPYGAERDAGVVPGGDGTRGVFTVGGTRVGVLVCADLWYSDLVAAVAGGGVDVLAVPAFSVTQWATPRPARELWRHMAVARAYEFICCVAVADWPEGVRYGALAAAGVSGMARPLPAAPGRYFTPAAGGVTVGEVDAARLGGLRANRIARGFHRSPV